MTLGQKIRAARLEQRLTQEQLGARDFTKSYISELERGNRTPRITTLKILARRLNRPLSYFLDGVTEDREPQAFLMVGLAFLHGESPAQASAWLTRAREAAATDDDELLHARINLALACVDQRLGHDLRAWRRAESVVRTAALAGDRRTLARAHECLGRSKLAAGDPSSAAWTFEAALQLLATEGPEPLAATLHYYLGIAREQMGHGTEAAEALRKAIELAESCADLRHAGAIRIEQAAAAAGEGSFDAAIAHAGEAIAVFDTVEHTRRLADMHWRLGDLEARAERWAEAQRHYSIGIAMYGAAKQVRGAARMLGAFVDAMYARPRPDVARAIGEAALALFPDDGAASGAPDDDRARTLWLRGTIQRALGRIDDARASLGEGLRLFELLRSSEEVKAVRRELALLAVEADDLATAREHLAVLRESSDGRRVAAGI